jgi:hypothetical protein
VVGKVEHATWFAVSFVGEGGEEVAIRCPILNIDTNPTTLKPDRFARMPLVFRSFQAGSSSEKAARVDAFMEMQGALGTTVTVERAPDPGAAPSVVQPTTWLRAEPVTRLETFIEGAVVPNGEVVTVVEITEPFVRVRRHTSGVSGLFSKSPPKPPPRRSNPASLNQFLASSTHAIGTELQTVLAFDHVGVSSH